MSEKKIDIVEYFREKLKEKGFEEQKVSYLLLNMTKPNPAFGDVRDVQIGEDYDDLVTIDAFRNLKYYGEITSCVKRLTNKGSAVRVFNRIFKQTPQHLSLIESQRKVYELTRLIESVYHDHDLGDPGNLFTYERIFFDITYDDIIDSERMKAKLLHMKGIISALDDIYFRLHTIEENR